MTTPEGTAAACVRSYYDLLQAGPEHFDVERLRALLAPDLDFEGPIAGRRVGAEPFLVGVRGFVAAARRIEMQRFVSDGAQVATLYEADFPGGAVRFAEFFEVGRGRITSLRLLYDADEYRSRAGG